MEEKNEKQQRTTRTRRTTRAKRPISRNNVGLKKNDSNTRGVEKKVVEERKEKTNKIAQRKTRRVNKKNNLGTSKEEQFGFKRPKLRIIPLGGLHEIGKNITVFEYGDDMIAVDCGLSFPEDDMLGVDLVIPDITYILNNKEKLKGLVITHGHEDHIGGIPYFLKQLNTPIYGTKLTIGLIKNKLEEHNLVNSTKLNIVEQGQTIKLGCFKIEFIRSTHSIPYFTAEFTICWTLWTFEAKVATTILFVQCKNNFSNNPPTVLSDIVKPFLSAFVLSDINANTPWFPISAILPKSINFPSIGV